MKKLIPKILFSAQHFGFGSQATIAYILKNLKRKGFKSDNYLVGWGNVTHFFKNYKELFDSNKIIETDIKGISNIDKKFDLIISCGNPYISIFGYDCCIPVINIDTNFWFWLLTKDKKNYDKYSQIMEHILKGGNYLEKISRLEKSGLTPHESQLLSNKCSLHSFLEKFPYINEKFPGTEKRIFRLGDILGGKNKFSEISPVLDLSVVKNKKIKKDYILINLNGMKNPVNDNADLDIYVKMIAKFISPVINELYKDKKFIIVVHPEIAERIKKNKKFFNLHAGIKVKSFSHREMLKIMEKTFLLITAPGKKSIYEAIHYGVPIIFLPEQNSTQYPQVLGYRKMGGEFPGILIYEKEKDLKKIKFKSGIEEMHWMYKKYEEWEESGSYQRDLLDLLKNEYSTDIALDKLAVKQRSVLNYQKGFAGADQISNFVIKYFQYI